MGSLPSAGVFFTRGRHFFRRVPFAETRLYYHAGAGQGVIRGGIRGADAMQGPCYALAELKADLLYQTVRQELDS